MLPHQRYGNQQLIWDYQKANSINIKKALNLANWQRLFEQKDINALAIALTETILNIFRNYVPNKYIAIDDKDPVWISFWALYPNKGSKFNCLKLKLEKSRCWYLNVNNAPRWPLTSKNTTKDSLDSFFLHHQMPRPENPLHQLLVHPRQSMMYSLKQSVNLLWKKNYLFVPDRLEFFFRFGGI